MVVARQSVSRHAADGGHVRADGDGEQLGLEDAAECHLSLASALEPGPRERYVINDLGASFGKTSWLVPGNRDNLEDFEREPFVERVEGNRVRFHFQGAWREPQLANLVTPSDVAWMCQLLTRLTRQQWMDAFRAADYDEPEASRYIRRLQEKVAEGLSLD